MQLIESVCAVSIGAWDKMKQVPHQIRLHSRVTGNPGGSGCDVLDGYEFELPVPLGLVDQRLGVLDLELTVEQRTLHIVDSIAPSSWPLTQPPD